MTTRLILGAALGAALGALFGFAQYKFAGCQTGACPLVGNPYSAVILWGLIGGLFGAGI
jgi:hypothetical protein